MIASKQTMQQIIWWNVSCFNGCRISKPLCIMRILDHSNKNRTTMRPEWNHIEGRKKESQKKKQPPGRKRQVSKHARAPLFTPLLWQAFLFTACLIGLPSYICISQGRDYIRMAEKTSVWLPVCVDHDLKSFSTRPYRIRYYHSTSALAG